MNLRVDHHLGKGIKRIQSQLDQLRIKIKIRSIKLTEQLTKKLLGSKVVVTKFILRITVDPQLNKIK